MEDAVNVGILTFHRACNYGAVLQAYALQQAVIKHRCNCKIIDYRNAAIEKAKKLYYPMSLEISIKHILAALLNVPLRMVRRIEFKLFCTTYLTLSEPVYPKDGKLLDESYEAILVGSDQVWNAQLTGFDKTYFLSQVTEAVRKYSYAASFGCSELSKQYEDEYKNLLISFQEISVREEQGRRMINHLMKKQVHVHPDPVFLLSDEEWLKLFHPIRKKGKYILIYSINPNNNLFEFANNLSKKRGLPVRYLLMDVTSILKIRAVRFTTAPSPQKFLRLIEEADTVITNSFHGTAFSIIFQKNFYSEVDYGNKINFRIQFLLENLNLSHRIITSAKVNEEEEIVWNEVSKKLNLQRDHADSYLENILESIRAS